MALGIGVRVNWIATGGPWPGVIISGPHNSPVFPGEVRWDVRLDSDPASPRTLEGRDLQEVGGFEVGPPDPGDLGPPAVPRPIPVPVDPPGAQPGDDLRDPPTGAPGLIIGAPGAVIGLGALALRLGPVAGRAVLLWFRSFARGATVRWESMPGWVRAALTAAGIVGTAVLIDDISDGIGGDGLVPHIPAQGGAPFHTEIVGSWQANGVTFYRLADGKLAVQNKKGRWKVWRPKKPIVLMPTGAIDIKTLLRADAVLARQAKRIASMLNRRAPRRRTPKSGEKQDSIIVVDGKVVKS